MASNILTMSRGSLLTPDHRRVALEHPNLARCLPFTLLVDHKLHSECGDQLEESALVDVDLSRKSPSRILTCLINAHSALKCSRQSMTGSATRSLFICLSNNGYVHSTDLVPPRRKSKSPVVSFVVKKLQTMHTSKHIIFQPVKNEA